MTFIHTLNPVLLKLGFIEIRWYGLMYVLGFIVTYFYLKWAVKTEKINLTLEDIDTLLIIEVIGMILGARLFEVLLYNPQYYMLHPSKILAIYEGGLSFHGALLGILLATWIFSKWKKISFLKLTDILIVPATLGIVFGRLGNFINGELPGRITSLPWGVKFPGYEGFRHPSTLYEMGYSLVIFFTLFSQRNKEYKEGILLAWFLIMYGIFRFFTEYVREPTVFVGPLTMGQALNIPMILLGVYILYWRKK